METPTTIRVVVIDDQETIHIEIRTLLSALRNIELVAHGYNGEEAVALCGTHHPDVVLMDISMPVMDGISATRIIRAHYPHIRVLALSGSADRGMVHKMIDAGASGYILKEAYPEEIDSTIRTVYSGKSVFSGKVLPPLLDGNATSTYKPEDFALTPREMEVLRAMGAGLKNIEVAQQLYITTATVRFHLANIIQKLGAENRTEALVIAARYGLI